MLDDLKVIHERDGQDALGVVEKQWQQLNYRYQVERLGRVHPGGIENIVIVGMGGSALAALLLTSWPDQHMPFEIVRDYKLPVYVDKHTLVVVSSYSGNTEEAVSAMHEALAAKAQVVVVAAGGKLAELAKEHDTLLFAMPAGLQPRMAVFYNFAALVQLMQHLRLVPANSLTELEAAVEWLKPHITEWRADVPTARNYAKQIAQELMGKSVVIYSGPELFPAAYKWKININENAKNIAWCNQYPEFNHNEMLGWSSHPVDKPYAVIELRSTLEHPRVQKRFEVSERLLSGKRPAPLKIKVEGDTILKQLLWVITLGDFVSIYLALLNGVNPTPVDLIEKFKRELAD